MNKKILIAFVAVFISMQPALYAQATKPSVTKPTTKPAAPVIRPPRRLGATDPLPVPRAEWDGPQSTTDVPVTGFQVQLDGSAWTDIGLVYYVPVPSSVGTHTVAVRACNDNGCGADSNASYTLTAPPPPPPVIPAAPSNLRIITTTATTASLAWTDNSDSELGFRVEQNGLEVGSVGPNVASFLATGLTPSTTYAYRVLALGTAGNSAYSNQVSAITAPPPDTTAPSVRITFLRQNGNSRNYSVTALVSDAVGVIKVLFKLDGITFNTQDLVVSGPVKSQSFSVTMMTGVSGSHTLTVEARDVAGNAGSASQTFTRR